ncbi:hypothetical protein Tco_0733375 [Tanacetum coccineum]
MTQEQRQLVARDEAWVPKADRQFWYTVKKIKKTTSYKFDLADKKCIVDFEVFRKILGICLKVQGEEFVETPSKESLLTFLIELGYKGQLNKLPNMFVDYMHQPWRTLAAFINKKYMSLTKAEEEEAARRVHATHERLVTESDEPSGELANMPTSKRRPASVVIRDTPTILNKTSLTRVTKALRYLDADRRRTTSCRHYVSCGKLEGRGVE